MLDPRFNPNVAKLTREEMTAMIHDDIGTGNLVAMPSGLNSSKQDKFGNWTEYKGEKLDATYARNLAITQREIMEKIRDWVDTTTKGRK